MLCVHAGWTQAARPVRLHEKSYFHRRAHGASPGASSGLWDIDVSGQRCSFGEMVMLCLSTPASFVVSALSAALYPWQPRHLALVSGISAFHYEQFFILMYCDLLYTFYSFHSNSTINIGFSRVEKINQYTCVEQRIISKHKLLVFSLAYFQNDRFMLQRTCYLTTPIVFVFPFHSSFVSSQLIYIIALLSSPPCTQSNTPRE